MPDGDGSLQIVEDAVLIEWPHLLLPVSDIARLEVYPLGERATSGPKAEQFVTEHYLWS